MIAGSMPCPIANRNGLHAESSIFMASAWPENARMDFLSALPAIVVIDLVLAGDNAIVIALAARNLPRDLQRRAVAWGTVGAVVVRASLTVAVLWLLEVPGLMAAGGALLVWIAYRLLTSDDAGGQH